MQKLVFSLFLFLSINLIAQSEALCDTELKDDIIITVDYIQVVNPKLNLFITPEGAVAANDKMINTTEASKAQAIRYQALIRERMTTVETQTYFHLNDIKAHFNRAIKEQAGGDSLLIKHLNKLHAQLTALFMTAIKSEKGQTRFNHRAFAKLYDRGSRIVTKASVAVFTGSVLEFRLKKNIKTLRYIGKTEWKKKKAGAKAFNKYVCDSLLIVDQEKKALVKALFI